VTKKAGPGYDNVAVCVGDACLERPDELTEQLLPRSYLVRADQVFVDSGGDPPPGRGWARTGTFRGVDVYEHADATPADPDLLPSGALVAQAMRAGAEPNPVFCSQGLRDAEIRDDIPFQVAPRYQGIGGRAEPAEQPQGLATPAPGPGRRIEIGIVDTGIAQGRFLDRWLEPCIAPRWLVSAADEDPPSTDDDGDEVEAPSGHGTFVAGVIAQCEPRVRMHVVQAVDRQGAVSDLTLARAIERLLEATDDRLDILNLSLGGWTRDNKAPRLTGPLIRSLRRETLVVAAAGNLRRRRKFWPAAMSRVVGVGAVVRSPGGWQRAEYSNRGAWIKAVASDGSVVAPGATQASGAQVSCFYAAFPTASYPRFTGWAQWLGTSFTAPKVTGRIAQLMIAEDVASAPEAWRRLQERSRSAADAGFANAVHVEDCYPAARSASPVLESATA
jgi:subtilisin family serine protease